MKKYWQFFRTNIQVTLTYRGPILVWILGDLISMLTLIAVWLSVSAAGQIGGYTRNELITYYIVALFLQWLNGWFPFYGVVDDIKSGSILFVLAKPYSYYWQKFMDDFGWHILSMWVGLAVSVVVGLVFRQYFVFNLSFFTLILFAIAVVLSVFVCFGLNFCLALFSFWFTQVWALNSLYWMARNFLGGQALPISFIPGVFFDLAKLLPFRYMFSFPLEIYFNKLSNMEIIVGYGLQIFWAVVLYRFYQFIWNRGRRAYTAFGQ